MKEKEIKTREDRTYFVSRIISSFDFTAPSNTRKTFNDGHCHCLCSELLSTQKIEARSQSINIFIWKSLRRMKEKKKIIIWNVLSAVENILNSVQERKNSFVFHSSFDMNSKIIIWNASSTSNGCSVNFHYEIFKRTIKEMRIIKFSIQFLNNERIPRTLPSRKQTKEKLL